MNYSFPSLYGILLLSGIKPPFGMNTAPLFIYLLTKKLMWGGSECDPLSEGGAVLSVTKVGL